MVDGDANVQISINFKFASCSSTINFGPREWRNSCWKTKEKRSQERGPPCFTKNEHWRGGDSAKC